MHGSQSSPWKGWGRMNGYAWRIQWTLLFFHPISESAEQSWFPFSLAPCPFTYLQRALATLWAESVRLWRVAFSAWWERLLTEVFPLRFFFPSFFPARSLFIRWWQINGVNACNICLEIDFRDQSTLSFVASSSNPLTNWIFCSLYFWNMRILHFKGMVEKTPKKGCKTVNVSRFL